MALCVSGALAEDDLIGLSHRRGRVIVEATEQMPGGMAALEANGAAVEKVLAGLQGVTIANFNAPKQTVISGTEEGLQAALERCKHQGIRGQRIPVACGFHSTLVTPAKEPLAQVLSSIRFTAPRKAVYSNTTGRSHQADAGAIPGLLAEHLTSPVRFQAEIEAMYEAGARIFVEVGPQAVLTGLVNQILEDKPHVAIASDLKGRPGLVQLEHLLGQLLVSGVPVQVGRLFQGRNLRTLDLANLAQETGAPKLSPSTWMVNSVRNRLLNAPEPVLIGQTRNGESKVDDRGSKIEDGGLRMEDRGLKNMLQTSIPTTPASMLPLPDAIVANAPTANGAGHPLTNQVPQAPKVDAPSSIHDSRFSPLDEAAQVMLKFQELMGRFLETQRSVMTSYLQGGHAAQPVPAPLPPFGGLVLAGQNGNGHTVHAPLAARCAASVGRCRNAHWPSRGAAEDKPGSDTGRTQRLGHGPAVVDRTIARFRWQSDRISQRYVGP